jgi:hypothetical protein
MTTREQAIAEWRRWTAREIGGSPDRVEASAQAVIAALDLKKSPEDTMAAARNAAAKWDSQHREFDPDLSATFQQWSSWIKQQIGGPPGRINAAMHAAEVAIAQHQSSEAIVAAARSAAALWDSKHPQPEPRGHGGLKVYMVLVGIIVAASFLSQLFRPGTVSRDPIILFILGVIFFLLIPTIFNVLGRHYSPLRLRFIAGLVTVLLTALLASQLRYMRAPAGQPLRTLMLVDGLFVIMLIFSFVP